MLFRNYKKFIFDLDGTVYKGNSLIEGAIETINKIKSSAEKLIFVSNKTTENPQDYCKFLQSHGANVEIGDFITSTMVIGKFLQQNSCGNRFFSISEHKFIEQLNNLGLEFTEVVENIDIVIVTLDRTFNFSKLEIAAKALENGARFLAANIDDTCPVENGEITDAGAIISALEKRTHRKLELHFGKPSTFMQNYIKEVFNDNLRDTLLVGDRISTDIFMANQMKIDSALVSTGIKNYENPLSDFKPTYRLNSIYDLIKL
jgi:HAD superfamily hydrolase (TIGR01450 family)